MTESNLPGRELTRTDFLKLGGGAGVALLLFGGLGCGGGTSGSGGGAVDVSVGTVAGSSADAAIFIALEKGYFEDQGINVSLEPFDSGARMIAPLGSGELDVASGSISAGLYNAIARGVNFSIVADKARAIPPEGHQALAVRKDLVDSGEFTGYEDLEGLTVTIAATGSASEMPLYLMLEEAGLSLNDVQLEELGFAEQISAFENGSIDAGILIEPSMTQAEQNGAAVRYAGTVDVLPNQQSSGILFGDEFAQRDDEVTRGFLLAYIQGVRYYNDALSDGRLSGPNADEIADILVEYTEVADPELYREIYLHGVHPDGELHVENMQRELQYWNEQGYIESDVAVEEAIDTSFLDAALEELGPYQGEYAPYYSE